MNYNGADKLQVKLLFAYISWKILAHFQNLFGKVILIKYSEKMNAKYMKENVWKSIFIHKVAGWHLATSLQINFFTTVFRVYRNSWTLDARVGRWTLDAGLWTLDPGRWTLDSVRWTLDAGLWTLDSGRWTVDVGLWMLDSEPWALNSRRWTPDAER